jgi:hypothetical protein
VTLRPFARVLVALRIMRRLRLQRRLGLEAVSLRIAWVPLAEDLARGAGPGQRGYFWGVAPEPARGEQLPDPTRARGELVVFLGHPSHASELEIERTFEHEIGHVLGLSEQQLAAMGLDA